MQMVRFDSPLSYTIPDLMRVDVGLLHGLPLLQRLANNGFYTVGEVAVMPERELKGQIRRPSTIAVKNQLVHAGLRLRFQREALATFALRFDQLDWLDGSRPMGKLLREPIERLDIGARAYNCLKWCDVHTIGRVTFYRAEDLIDIPNFGMGSLREVTAALAQFDLRLRRAS